MGKANWRVGWTDTYVEISSERKIVDTNLYQFKSTSECVVGTRSIDHIRKTAVTETLKFGGSVYGGYYGSVAGSAILAVAFGVSTGGLGFVVLGAGAVIGGTIGGLVVVRLRRLLLLLWDFWLGHSQ